MSASDDTQKKLIDSIRKTKQTAASTPAAKPAASRAKRSGASASSAGGRSRKAPARKRQAKPAPTGQGYQAGRRVWPD